MGRREVQVGHAERYVERRVGVISPASTANERRYLKYAKATIGSIPLKELVAEDVDGGEKHGLEEDFR